MSNIPTVPKDMPFHHQQFLAALKHIIETKFPPDVPPGNPSNVTAHPMPGGVQITFTGGDQADKHLLLVSDQSTWNPARANNHVIDLGQGTMHVHQVGQAGVARHYWIIGVRGNAKSPRIGPVTATTLPLATPAANSTYVPLTPHLIKSVGTGHATIMKPRKGGQRDLL